MAPSMTNCPSCGQETPEGRFCVRCGAHLEDDRPPSRRAYAASPHEHVHVPRIVSSLFPHLPRAQMATFRVSLAAGAAVVLVLGLAKLFSLGLIAAALLVP